jgi:hypothetical protein
MSHDNDSGVNITASDLGGYDSTEQVAATGAWQHDSTMANADETTDGDGDVHVLSRESSSPFQFSAENQAVHDQLLGGNAWFGPDAQGSNVSAVLLLIGDREIVITPRFSPHNG